MFLKELLLPPGCFILLLMLGLLLLKRRPRAGKGVILVSTILFYLSSTPWISNLLLASLERNSPLRPEDFSEDVQAIVVLGAGIHPTAPEYGQPNVNGPTLERILYAAYLQRRTRKPILVSGGRTSHPNFSEALVMKETLEKDFGATVFLFEEESRNTYENALNSSKLLKERGVHKIYLVTHAFHMPRAKLLFEKFGMQVIPAPTVFFSRSPFSWKDLLPTSLWESQRAIQEWIGILLSIRH